MVAFVRPYNVKEDYTKNKKKTVECLIGSMVVNVTKEL